MKEKLIIVAASSRLKDKIHELMKAIDRYDGVYFRVLRKYLREGKLTDTDILIVSQKFGLLWADDEIPYYQSFPGSWGSLSLNEEEINKLRRENLRKLEEIARQYASVYINVGKEYLQLIEGFEDFVTGDITYAKGTLGQKARHMKNWILSKTLHNP